MKNLTFLLLLISDVILAQTNDFVVHSVIIPKKQEKIITVGGANADITGFTNEAIQMAIDALPDVGGTVKLKPGLFAISAPVRVPSNCTLTGSGPETILRRIDGFRSKLTMDADYGELKIAVEDASGFAPGMSIVVSDDINSGCIDVTIGVITDIDDNLLYIDANLIRDYSFTGNGKVSNAGSCITLTEADNVVLSDFKIEGNKQTNDWLAGCYAGGICLIKARNVTVENALVEDFNGEGITWQITENITIRNCEIRGCYNGLHPGTGSVNSLIEGNNSHHNDGDGLFVCYRVQHGLVKNNSLHHNTLNGISTGHKDSDMKFENNHIFENNRNGVFFRDEDQNNSPHRNVFIGNLIENNGNKESGYGFLVNGKAMDVLIKDNTIRDTGKGLQKAAVFFNKNTPPVKLENNKMSGHTLGDVVYGKE
jgi:nitrous oxidase accessory protein NosD